MQINDIFCIGKTDKLKRAEIIVERINPYLKNSKNLLDIGCGNGYIASILKKQGKKITAVDIADNVLAKNIKPVLYDGKKLPFADKKFDTTLLLTVLHHCPVPEVLFEEAMRVSDKIIIIEDICNNFWQKLMNVFFDSLQNRPLRFYWNSYRSDLQWKTFFTKKGFKIKADYFQDLPYLHAVYSLNKEI